MFEYESKTVVLLDQLKQYEDMYNIIYSNMKGDYKPEYINGKLVIGNKELAIRTDGDIAKYLLKYFKDMINTSKKNLKKELERNL